MLNLWSNHSDCLDRNGSPKKRYYSLSEAQDVAQYLFEMKGLRLRVYQCNKCGYYHLTKDV